jgi:uncharacterized protein (TIGR02266 family)
MDEFLEKAPLEELETLLGDLRAELDGIYSTGTRLAEVASLDEIVTGLEYEAREMLSGAEFTDELQTLERSLTASDKLRKALNRELTELVKGLKEMVEKAADRAIETRGHFERSIDSALQAMEHKRVGLEIVISRTRTIQNERQRLKAELPEAFEETMPFEDFDDPEEAIAAVDAAADDGERRRGPRNQLSISVKLEGHNRLLRGATENVSVGGMFIDTQEGFELGTLLNVSCALPGGRVVKADGLVTWIREAAPDVVPGIGVEFLAMSDEDREALEEL